MPLRAWRRGASYGRLRGPAAGLCQDQEKEERSTAVWCVPLCGNHLIVLLLILVVILVIIIVGVGVGCGGGGLVVAGIEAAAEVEALHRRAVTQQAHRAGFLTTTPTALRDKSPLIASSLIEGRETKTEKAET